MRSKIFIFLFLVSGLHGLAQKSGAYISGRILDENEKPLAKVSITMLGKESGLVSTDSGTFRMHVPADKAFALVFSYTGYKNHTAEFHPER